MDDSTRIRVKIKNGHPTAQTRQGLMSIIKRKNINIHRLLDMQDGWVIVCQAWQDVQEVMEAEEDIKQINLDIVIPAHMQNKCVLVVKKIDNDLFNYTEQEIIKEIEYEEQEAVGKVKEIYKMQNHGIIKIKLENLQIAAKIKEGGIKIFGCIYNIIEFERNNKIAQCMKCYAYAHSTSACKSTILICSECAQTGHTWKQCEEREKKCVTCQGAHRTFSGQCKIRKEKILTEEKKRKNREEENMQLIRPITEAIITNNKTTENTFANVLKQNIAVTTNETRQLIESNNKEINENIALLVTEAVNKAVKAEINEIHDKVKKTFREIITQEMTSHITALKEMQEMHDNTYSSIMSEIHELKEELKKEREQRIIINMQKRKAKETGTDTESENFKAPPRKLKTKKKIETRKATPISHNMEASTDQTNKKEIQNREINKKLEFDIDTDNIMREISSASVDEFDEAEIDHYIENMTNTIATETSPENKIPSNETSPEIMPMVPITVTREIINYSNQQEIEIKEQNIKIKESNVDEVYRREHEEFQEEEKKRREIIQEKKRKIQKEIVKEIKEAIEEYDKNLNAGPIHGILDWTPPINLLEISPSPNMQRWAELERKLEQEDKERRYMDDE